MTTQLFTLLSVAVVGVVLFFTGRISAKKLSSEGSTFMPASIITVRGIAVYFSILVSWFGAMLAVACMLVF